MHAQVKKIVDDASLSQNDKIKRLQTMLEDEVIKLTASEEGMGNDADSPLSDILEALHSLGIEVDVEHGANQKDAIITKKVR